MKKILFLFLLWISQLCYADPIMPIFDKKLNIEKFKEYFDRDHARYPENDKLIAERETDLDQPKYKVIVTRIIFGREYELQNYIKMIGYHDCEVRKIFLYTGYYDYNADLIETYRTVTKFPQGSKLIEDTCLDK
ncbi:hypothetical protein ASC84_03060 [Acinetobacter sp. Root1280]|jgi:hypothetical protein|uniref:hypothetical protein n=1 Tax=Acinetobacter sp. Root1280 TaxID=1736444 RepID=UPI0006FB5881|nr:hypothetical protein [Acinetobacter sp. Root1280]KQX03698.1 hypothetical protein ASC84_03060 [Acinetobacter sp. Root1280]